MSKRDKEFYRSLQDLYNLSPQEINEMLGVSRQAVSRGINSDHDYFSQYRLEIIGKAMTQKGLNLDFLKELATKTYDLCLEFSVAISFATSHRCDIIIIGEQTDHTVAYLQMVNGSKTPIALPPDILGKIQQTLNSKNL